MMNRKLFLMLAASLVGSCVQAEMVEYFEDAYSQQASPELVKKAEDVASMMAFEGKYQVVAPKKSGIDINPWNKFIAAGINPQMQYPLMIINSAWFDTLPQDQQTFFLVRTFVTFKEGFFPATVKYTPYAWLVFVLLLLLAIVWLLRNSSFVGYKKWLIAVIIVVVFDLAVGRAVQTKVIQYFGKKHDMHIIRLAVEKTGNKEAAKNALLAFNAALQDEVKNGQKIFESYSNFFEQYANQL